MLRKVHLAVFDDRRDERKSVDEVVVDADFAERRRDCGSFRRDKAVLDPCAVARRKKDYARELSALHKTDSPPCGFT